MLNAGILNDFKGAATLLLWGDGEGMESLFSNFSALRDGSRTEFGIDGLHGVLTVCVAPDFKRSTVRAADDGFRWDCSRDHIELATDLIEPLLHKDGHQFLDVTGLAERVIVSRGEYSADLGSTFGLDPVSVRKRGAEMQFQNGDFIRLVKRTREKFLVSIEEAHDLIFADEEMRRLVAWRVNNDPDCRKQALWDIRHKGKRSRFVQAGDRINFRKPDGQR